MASPIIYKPQIYNGPTLYKGDGSVYNGNGVYNDGAGGGNEYFPDNLIALFYGDYVLDINNYIFRGVNPNYIKDVHRANISAKNISSSVMENTPLGYIPIFRFGNLQNGDWWLSAKFKDDFKASNFTIETWLYYGTSNPWGERTRLGQMHYYLSGIVRYFVVGPYSNMGFYYNGGSGGMNFNTGNLTGFDGTWHHLEFDVDISTHKMKFYFDGVLKNEISLTQYISQLTINDILEGVWVVNDGNNHPDVKTTQTAFWNKLMNGSCYSKGLYHDGTKFLI